MKIIILGAGQVGTTVAHSLATEDNEIVVVDTHAALLRDLQDRLDLGTVLGNGAHPKILERAGAAHADMLIAMTNDDVTNMLACQVAYRLFKIPRKVARIRTMEYLSYPQLFGENGIPIDAIISPEQMVTRTIQSLLEFPGATHVLDFASGKVRLVSVRAMRGGPLVGREIRQLHQNKPTAHARIAAIFRHGEPIIPDGNITIKADDEVFFVAPTNEIHQVMHELRESISKPYKNIVFAGGGNIGTYVTKTLENQYHIKLIEKDQKRANMIAAQFRKAIVLVGDSADEELLISENIGQADVFCAITNDDQGNILSAMLAKHLGVPCVMSLINRHAYVSLVESNLVDLVISPSQVTIGSILRYVRRGDVVQVHSLRRGAAEAIEAIAHAGKGGVVGKRIDEIKVPAGIIIGALVRGEEVLMVHHDSVIEEGDHVIMFLIKKQLVSIVEKLFHAA